MIVDALFGVITAVLLFGAEILPEVNVVDLVADKLAGWSLFMSSASAANYYFPMVEVFTAVLAVVFVLPLFLGASLVLWVVAFVRGGSSRA